MKLLTNFFKRLLYVVQLLDFVWSVPLAITLFMGSGWVLQLLFTDPQDPQGGPGFYDPSFLQVMFFASCMQVFVNGVVWAGIYFNFRGLWRYYTGQKEVGTENIVNTSKADFLSLKPWLRLGLLLFMYCFLSVEWLFLFSVLL